MAEVYPAGTVAGGQLHVSGTFKAPVRTEGVLQEDIGIVINVTPKENRHASHAPGPQHPRRAFGPDHSRYADWRSRLDPRQTGASRGARREGRSSGADGRHADG